MPIYGLLEFINREHLNEFFPKLNKYVMVICFDLNLDEKIINIVVF